MVCFVHAIMGHCSVPELYCILTLVWSPQGALTSYCQTTYFHTYLDNYMFIACNRLQCLHLLMHTEGRLICSVYPQFFTGGVLLKLFQSCSHGCSVP